MFDWNGQIRGWPVAGDLLLVIGVLLVVNAAGGFVLDVGSPAYRYDTVQVTDGDQFLETIPNEATTVDCLHVADRLCVLESWVVRSGAGTVTDGTRFVQSDRGTVADTAGSIAVLDGRLYQRSLEMMPRDDGPARAALTYRPIDERAALDELAVPQDAPWLSPAARRIVTNGPITRSSPLDLSETVVETDDGYAVIYGYQTDDSDPLVGGAVRAVQAILGAVAIGRGRTRDSVIDPIIEARSLRTVG
ncbi:hypothetical protein [Halococcoides cellulosivorans]|uniref:Uncharacterized protein n=1 Tax=Halococcoides cellulosivorans TaxID=1679096 RepID=A0A2R4X4C2_9EURY|nr:hypothetical protein [Halococcoides cellulosivorans]AWB28543.1 hypothetical protein HARCEL1_13055 [Halococcoides cellulosivorans]